MLGSKKIKMSFVIKNMLFVLVCFIVSLHVSVCPSTTAQVCLVHGTSSVRDHVYEQFDTRIECPRLNREGYPNPHGHIRQLNLDISLRKNVAWRLSLKTE